jgi:hypothetical protein
VPHQPTAQRMSLKFLTMQKKQSINRLFVISLDQYVTIEELCFILLIILWQHLGVFEVRNLFAEEPHYMLFFIDLGNIRNFDVEVFVLEFCQFLFYFKLCWNNVL